MNQQAAHTDEIPGLVVIDDGMPPWTCLAEKLPAMGFREVAGMRDGVVVNPFDLPVDLAEPMPGPQGAGTC